MDTGTKLNMTDYRKLCYPYESQKKKKKERGNRDKKAENKQHKQPFSDQSVDDSYSSSPVMEGARNFSPQCLAAIHRTRTTAITCSGLIWTLHSSSLSVVAGWNSHLGSLSIHWMKLPSKFCLCPWKETPTKVLSVFTSWNSHLSSACAHWLKLPPKFCLCPLAETPT